ncbi:pericentrin [Elgaria multicarinata webbii]|uniref:pericentrin n=1 Tax=Elgaria multicarinata webbii TaxID=159646 RepID=UPI002FCD2472
MWQLNHHSQSPQLTQKIMDDFKCIGMDKASWDSPEIMRKLNNSMELQTSLPVTPFSEVDILHSIGFADLYPENSVILGDNHGLLECPISYFNGNEKTASSLFQSLAFSGSTFSVPEYNSVPESIPVRDAEGFTLMPPELQDDLKSTMPRLESANTEYGSNTSSDLIFQLNWKDPETTIHQDGNVMAYLQCFGMVPDVTEPAMKERELFSQQLKNVLKMLYEESFKILVLSEKSLPLGDDEKNVQQAPSMEEWQRERLTLLDTVQSLKDYLNNVSDKEDKEQRQKIVLEHLLSSDRNSLLTEIQDLESQLRLMHLQSKEKLQQLQETLTNTENLGSKQEHQLRRQVELLEYNLQQEKLIASDLQASVQREQEKASEVNELLKEKHTAILNLKSELCESKQTNERLEKSLQELQREVIKYRSALENKNVFQDLQNEQLKEKELQNMLDEQHHQHKIREDEKSKAIEELQAALELQCIQNHQLSVALEHEQSTNSNLCKKLQIEHSRCEVLLSQDQNKLLELQKNIDVEKNRSLELLSALNHERVLTEQLSVRINECRSCKHKDLLQELQAQLFIERSYARELLAIIEKTQQQALDSKKQMDEMQRHCEEPQKKQNYTSLQVTQATLQNQKHDIIHTLDIQREEEEQLKKEWEQLQPIPRAHRDQENRAEQRITERRQQRQQTEYHKLKELQKTQSQHEFKVRHWKNTGRIQQLQKMLEDLKEQEKLNYKNQQKVTSCPSKSDYSNLTFSADPLMLHVEQQKLENIREQLLFAAAYLSEFIYKTVDRTIKWPASNDEAAAALLYILELKAELLTPSKPPVIPTCIINSMKESDRIACQEEKSILQNGFKATENDATKTNFVLASKSTMASPNLKMQKLYRKYLRAESFRKALIYQKKYLLLLLGGFQECEQATLSLIARMGIYPSPTDQNMSNSRSRSFTKFRSAVRAVTAISRLKFLMKKWHKVGRKEMPPEAISPTIANKSYPGARAEILKQQKPFPGYVTQEAGYYNRSNNVRLVNYSPKSPHHLHNRFSSASQASSKDPEHSLTEYIAHLEAIQQRLGILMPGQSRL